MVWSWRQGQELRPIVVIIQTDIHFEGGEDGHGHQLGGWREIDNFLVGFGFRRGWGLRATSSVVSGRDVEAMVHGDEVVDRVSNRAVSLIRISSGGLSLTNDPHRQFCIVHCLRSCNSALVR
jgi:hypothetical protein